MTNQIGGNGVARPFFRDEIHRSFGDGWRWIMNKTVRWFMSFLVVAVAVSWLAAFFVGSGSLVQNGSDA